MFKKISVLIMVYLNVLNCPTSELIHDSDHCDQIILFPRNVLFYYYSCFSVAIIFKNIFPLNTLFSITKLWSIISLLWNFVKGDQ